MTEETSKKPVKGSTEFVGLVIGAVIGTVFKWLTMTYLSIQILTYMGAL
jgi:hypothetical protein